ncbi:hypothetical protein BLNAU_2407 [Blattamonas nauphoetae]|uniref:Uncharacterized protein n=1 Tax=Blattamonas nauphoetae TaxID=2049346 RepID=A0ABQ9YFN1_9EUKA|nr:hypothetical protein BLNAU_2407 [Blattamonas nauphoetae]
MSFKPLDETQDLPIPGIPNESFYPTSAYQPPSVLSLTDFTPTLAELAKSFNSFQKEMTEALSSLSDRISRLETHIGCTNVPTTPPPEPVIHTLLEGVTMSNALYNGTILRLRPNTKQIEWKPLSTLENQFYPRTAVFHLSAPLQVNVFSLSIIPYFSDDQSIDFSVFFLPTKPNQPFSKKIHSTLKQKGRLDVKSQKNKANPIMSGDTVRIEIDFRSNVLMFYVNRLPVPYKIVNVPSNPCFALLASSPKIRAEVLDASSEEVSLLEQLPVEYHPTEIIDFQKIRTSLL